MSFRVKMLKNVTHFLGNRTPQARRCYFSRVPHRESLQFSNFDVIDMQKLFVTMEVRTFLQNISSTESFKFLEIIRRRADFSLIYFLLLLEYIWKRADVDESHIERIKLDEVENFSELRKKKCFFDGNCERPVSLSSKYLHEWMAFSNFVRSQNAYLDQVCPR